MGIAWILIALVVFVVFVFFKFKEFRHQLSLFLVIGLILFFLISFGNQYASNHFDLKTFDGVIQAGRVYFSWLGSFTGKVVKVSSYVVQQDWDMNASAAGP